MSEVELYCGDCRKHSAKILDNSCALAFVDPPYWVDFNYKNGLSDKDMDRIDPVWLVSEMKRIAQVAIVTPGISNLYDYPKPDWVYGWYKPGSTRRSMVLNGFNTWEPLLIYGKPSKRVYQDSSYLPSVSNLNGADANFHGCPKPLKLMKEIIEKFTEPGETVADLMFGSGTTGVAALQLGRRFIGVELDENYFNIAVKRITDARRAAQGLPKQLAGRVEDYSDSPLFAMEAA